METLTRTIRIARPAAEVFAWHERSGAFERLQPPWERVEMRARAGGVRDGLRVALRTRAGPVWLDWEVEHRDYVAGVQFRDVQLRGPFAHWEHLHRFAPDGPEACVLTDEIDYALPGGPAGALLADAVRRRLSRVFAYRHAVTKADLEGGGAPVRPRRVLVGGASGLVGRMLVPFLTTQGHEVVRLVRRPPAGPDEVFWDPALGVIDLAAAGPVDAVVNLGGSSIAAGRWTASRRHEILASRVDSTRTLVQALVRLRRPPEVLVSASAVGFYGDRGDERLDETVPPGRGFLAEVCQAWEAELAPAHAAGLRTVALRTGAVLTPAGGALARLRPLFLAGLGGCLGSGRQWMAWIAPDDLAGLIHAVLRDPRWTGAVNAAAPEPVTNAQFAAVLARVLRRPASLPAPAWALRAALGGMADEMLLASTRAEPARARSLGYAFRYPTLELALRHGLGS